jgi:aminopeptidase
MLNDRELVKYADVLLWGLKVAKKGILKKNEIILLQYELPALKLAEVLLQKSKRETTHLLAARRKGTLQKYKRKNPSSRAGVANTS